MQKCKSKINERWKTKRKREKYWAICHHNNNFDNITILNRFVVVCTSFFLALSMRTSHESDDGDGAVISKMGVHDYMCVADADVNGLRTNRSKLRVS